MTTGLARKLGFWDIYLMSLGQIIGAGIFILIGKSAKYANNYTWLSFLIAGVLSIVSGFSYVELSKVFKSNAAENDYIGSVFGEKVGLISTIILLLIGVFTITTVSLGMGEYLNKKLNYSKITSAIFIILFYAGINIIGVKTSSNFNMVATFIEFFGLLALVIGAFSFDLNILSTIPQKLFSGGKIIYGSLIAMFAYMGFESTVRLTEEAINPDKDIPLALISSIITATILYVLVAWIVTSIIGGKKLTLSATPIEDAAKMIFGSKISPLFGFIAFVSISNTILLGLLTNSRILYSISELYPQLSSFRYVDETTKTPIISILAVTFLSLLALSLKDVEKSAVIASWLFFIILALVNLSLIILHFQGKYKKEFGETFTGKINNKFPIFPLIGFTSCIGIMFSCMK
jgi:basic amino acid/polyamine antiporter, APA family